MFLHFNKTLKHSIKTCPTSVVLTYMQFKTALRSCRDLSGIL